MPPLSAAMPLVGSPALLAAFCHECPARILAIICATSTTATSQYNHSRRSRFPGSARVSPQVRR